MTALARWLAVVAVLVRSIFGSGVMPDAQAAANGEFELVICTGSGLTVLPSEPDDEDAPRTDSICPFSVLTHSAIPAAPTTLKPGHSRPALSAAAIPQPLRAAIISLVRARAPPSQS